LFDVAFVRGVKSAPAFNRAKAGKTETIQFSLDGFQGLNIFAPGYPVSQLIACDSGAPIVGSDPLPFSPTLTYSARHDIYSLAWTTDAAWDGTCRQVAIRLSDGYT
jgi:hypothetical protein